MDHLDPKKKGFKGKCHYCKKLGHKISNYFKIKNKCEREGISLVFSPLALVCFESNNFEIYSNYWWSDYSVIVHVTNYLQGLKNRQTPSEREKTILRVEGSSPAG